METEVMRYILTQGAFAALFVYLLFYVLKENSKRENNYQTIISTLTNKLNVLEEVKKSVDKIEEKIK